MRRRLLPPVLLLPVFLPVVGGSTAASLAAEPVRQGKLFHEAEVGWASRHLAEALGIPLADAGFSDGVRRLSRAAAEQNPPGVDEVSTLLRTRLQGLTLGVTTQDWIAQVTLDNTTMREDPKDGLIGVSSIAAWMLPIVSGMQDTEGMRPDDVALYTKGLLLLFAEPDFFYPSNLVFRLREDGFAKRAGLTREQEGRLEAFRVEAQRRADAIGAAVNAMSTTLMRCRDENREPTEEEQAQLIQRIDVVRETGAIDQSAWWMIARNAYAILRLSGVPAEGPMDTPFARYLRDWHASLPECNARRWLGQALTAGRELKPVEIMRMRPGESGVAVP